MEPSILINFNELQSDTMSQNVNDEQKYNHPYYKLMELQGEELKVTLNFATRSELIEWLCWNDRNGVYKDTDSLREFGNIVSKEEAIEIIHKQISEN